MNGLIIGVVGPCAAGKSTIVAKLRELGYQARHIAQEHSYVPAMWQRITNPDVLIFLDASYPVTILRRNLNWSETEYKQQIYRLAHARQHAHLYINTDNLSISQVFERVLDFLKGQSTYPPVNSKENPGQS